MLTERQRVVKALGRQRADRAQAAARQLMTLADDDAASTEAVAHFNVPLHAHNAHDATAELANLLNGCSKREEWARYWVLPLLPDTPDEFVDWLERTIQARLGLPRQNRHWRRS